MDYLNLLSISDTFADIKLSFIKTFLREDRWLQFLKGLGVTLEISFFAVILGVVLGFIIALVRSSHDKLIGKNKCRKFSDCAHSLAVLDGTAGKHQALYERV